MAVIDSLADKIIEYDYLIDGAEQLQNLSFAVIENTSEIIEKQKNFNTKRTTKSHMKLFTNFLKSAPENRVPENVKYVTILPTAHKYANK